MSGENCGLTRGPDGALKIVIFPGSHINCSDATAVANAFSPHMASGTQQSVQGWDCGPSQIAGVLAKCTRTSTAAGGSDTIGFLTD